MLEWYNKIKDCIEKNEARMVNMRMRKHQINTSECNADAIMRSKKLKKNNVRRYFEC